MSTATAPDAAIGPATERPAPGRRADPRSWLLLIVCANLAFFVASGRVAAFATAGCAVAMLIHAGARRAAAVWGAIALVAGLMWLGIPAVLAVLPGEAGDGGAGRAIVEGVLGTVAIIGTVTLRFGAVAAIAGAFLAATRVSALTAALGRMRVPRVIIIPLGVTFRFLPVIREEYARISDAMRMRGIQPGPRALLTHPVRTVTHILVPLISATLRAADDLAASALMRGLGANPRPTSVQDLRFRRADVPVTAAAAMLLCLALADLAGMRP